MNHFSSKIYKFGLVDRRVGSGHCRSTRMSVWCSIIFNGRQHSLLRRALYYSYTIGISVCLSVCPSHAAGTESKRRKLGSRSLHRRIAQGF